MLHEVLLALSGHPSPLFNESDPSQLPKDAPAVKEFGLLTPSEKALLRSIGHLSELHRKTRHHVEHIAKTHASTICRAVATSIQQLHLARFQDKVLEVESKILTKDTALVGAYDIVPLAGVVGEFDDWHRRMQWYWHVAGFMQPVDRKSTQCTGSGLIDKLRAEQQTGFADVETVAVELSKVAETAWLRQLASWVLYGRLPSFGANDFFIQPRAVEDGDHAGFIRDRSLLPKLVSATTASSILFIGKSLHQVRQYGRMAPAKGLSGTAVNQSELTAKHLGHLSALSLPIGSAQLSRAISAIRLSLSQNILKLLLPMDTMLELLSCMREFFLLGRGEFAVALIAEADKRVDARQQSMGRLLQQDPTKALQGLTIKDAEFQQTLSQTWKALASQDEDADDDALDFARRHMSLATPTNRDSRPSTSDSTHGASAALSTIAFSDILFPSAVNLGLSINPPLDLFISAKDVDTYAIINAYLLSIRRAQLRLSDLWRKTPARRDYPKPERTSVFISDDEIKQKISKRRIASRKMWATTSAALFLLSETSGYFEGEIIRESWDLFEKWVKEPASEQPLDEVHKSTASEVPTGATQKDPETLTSGHRAFLASLAYALMLNDIPYTKELRSLLGNVDQLIAFFSRQLEIQQKLDVEHDSGGETAYTLEEETRISLELDRARKRVDSDLKSVVNRLRQLDQERIGSGRYLNISSAESDFEPWKGGGVDRLLMKLEFGRMTEEGYDIV
jgi:hypothetical protein